MTAKYKLLYKENNKHDKATVNTNKKMIQVIGHFKYYLRNEDSTHETILETKFMDPSFWIRVNEHLKSQHCYKKTLTNTNFIKLYIQPIYHHS